MNTVLLVIFAFFMSYVGFVLADNRFELDPMLYRMIIIIWVLVGIHILAFYVIKEKEEKHKSIPLAIIIFLGVFMIGIIAMTFLYPTASILDTAHEYAQNQDQKVES